MGKISPHGDSRKSAVSNLPAEERRKQGASCGEGLSGGEGKEGRRSHGPCGVEQSRGGVEDQGQVDARRQGGAPHCRHLRSTQGGAKRGNRRRAQVAVQ